MTASDAWMMLSMLSSAESFSIFETTSMSFGIFVRSSAMSAARRTKLSARYSSRCSFANATSAQSFSVIDGALTSTPGKFIPLWLLMRPPWRTRQCTRVPDTSSVTSSINPSSTRIRSPTFTSLQRPS